MGAWELITRQVKIVDFLPTQREVRQVFYIRASDSPTYDWRDKFAALGRTPPPASLTFTAGDLNAFLKSAAGDAKSKASVSVRLTDDTLQIGAQTYPTWLAYPLCIQAQGVIKKGDGAATFEPSRCYIGSLPLPRWLAQPFISSVIIQAFGAPSSRPIVDSWNSLRTVQIKNERMVLSWR